MGLRASKWLGSKTIFKDLANNVADDIQAALLNHLGTDKTVRAYRIGLKNI